MLKEKGIKTAETEIPSDRLKATQSELVGAKVAGMSKALEKDPNHPAITAPIYVSRDGYVIDGHHRWAAVTSAAIAEGRPANMKVIVIDMDIKDAIPLANKFAEEIGVAAKKADANQEGPKKDEPKSEPDYDKYTNKSQTMTDFFKGDLSIDDLQKVAKKNFDSEIATERDLDGFLNNKFMQDVMADEHGVDKETLISKVKDLKTALFGSKKESKSTRLTSILKEAKRYDIGSGWMGNGLTIWNRAEEKNGDYKQIAHISKDGTLKIYDKGLPSDIKKMFQTWADTMKKGDRPGTY
jgi:hypothetical protein